MREKGWVFVALFASIYCSYTIQYVGIWRENNFRDDV